MRRAKKPSKTTQIARDYLAKLAEAAGENPPPFAFTGIKRALG